MTACATLRKSLLPLLKNGKILRQRSIRRGDERADGGGVAFPVPFLPDLPVFRFARNIQAAAMNAEGLVQAEQHAHEDIHAELPLDVDHVELPRQVIVWIGFRAHLFQKMALVLNEQGHRNPVGHLPVENG